MKASCLPALSGLLLTAGASAETLEWDTSAYSQEITSCDIEASHGDDPYSVAPGVSQQDMDFAKAIAACEEAVEADPANPRLRYQLARAYGYSGQGEKAYPHREAAIAADYPQALFVNGYLHFLGINKAEKDICKAGRLFRRSAQYGRLAGQVGFTRYALDDTFEGCDVIIDPGELMGFLDAAEESNGDFYESMLIGMLQEEVQAALGGTPRGRDALVPGVKQGVSTETLEWDASPYSQEITPCDEAATHPSDPNGVAPGVSQADMDFPVAIAACESAVAADPDNPRLHYQLARVYTYAGQTEKGWPHMEAAMTAEYPQALFVSGYMQYLGRAPVAADACAAGWLLQRSAQYGRLAGQVGFSRYALEGGFDGCEGLVDPQMLGVFLAAAAEATSDFYRTMLIGMLQKELGARD